MLVNLKVALSVEYDSGSHETLFPPSETTQGLDAWPAVQYRNCRLTYM